MEMGIDNIIHLDYELFKMKYDINDWIKGRIIFKKVRMRVKLIELHLIKMETVDHSNTQKTDRTVITKYEVCDGKPDVDDIVPIRMHIGCYDLCPTYNNVSNYMSVRYFLKIVIIDDEDKMYSRDQEIYLWRKHL